ncbi:bifunctional diguanylate cyclase/phosphodiesterase [Castellaniella defragrans]|uniref:Diguanylate cyclase (GGDEF)-like protein/PAS domain S-box-containing protein n=1 Tax=Castellaniella defragrans TaxID=75697 RepID=A0A7W9TKY7_CASDE|nr:EAL domain-containing protein [Castellaniella defragrans]KAB0624145.1 EAL domain-containing protein [Castellaniella defragrans]MBB6082635.1 diguanylate cyclase (GGDEF)-like protein/PAS domain S-box-containing protein [Castellaniella defragrans]
MTIHPAHLAESRRAFGAASALLVILIVVTTLRLPAAASDVSNFLPLHMALETLSIVVASLIFGLIWSSRHEKLPANLLWVASAFLAVALLDFLHVLTLPGMPDFIVPGSTARSTGFWLAARLVGALGLLAAVWLPWRTRPARMPLSGWQLIGLLLVFGVTVLLFRAPAWLPATYIPGWGPTGFTVGAEYTIVALNLLAAARLLWLMRGPRRFNAGALFAAACIMAQSEFFLTRYMGVMDVYNLFGHLYKVLAYLYLYRAVFVETVQHPYALLEESRRRLQATLEALPDLVVEMDARGRYLAVHAAQALEMSRRGSSLKGRLVEDILPPQAAGTVLAALAEAGRQGVSRGRTVSLRLGRDLRWFELSVARKPARPGGIDRYVVIARDVTQRHENEQMLRKFSLAVAQSPVSIMILDTDYRIEYVNEAYSRLSGYTGQELLGRSPTELWSPRMAESVQPAIRARIARGEPWKGELVSLDKAGREFTESVLIYPVRNADGKVTNYLSLKENITEKKQAAARIQQLSHYDQLTGLPNRMLLHEHFQYASQQFRALAVLWIDLDRFKDINDSLGHRAGDALLQEMAHRLRTALRAQDILSRLSGDDFLAILPGAGQQEAARGAQALLDAVALPLRLDGQETFVTASVGIALYPSDADQLDILLKHAETAMYRVKSDGRNGSCFFTPEMQARSARLIALGHALKQAQQRGELRLVYQPQLRLSEHRIFGAEALLRWDSPQWGAVSPAEFIPIAESSGLILSIGDWVLRTALRQVRHWLDRGLPDLVVAVNLSAVQFDQPDLPDRISRMLDEAGVPPHCLELELTEAAAMKTPETAAQKIQDLHQRGIRLAIDDFGTGYSSLSYLKRFKIHKLKIDQSFVRDIDSDVDDQAIASAIIQMARSLSMSTIAEGVETAEQLAFLRASGCDDIQGYHFSRPLEPDAFEHFVLRGVGES